MQVEERLRLETSAGLCRLCSWGSKSGRVGKRVACECHELGSPTILVVEHVALESGEAVRSVLASASTLFMLLTHWYSVSPGVG